MIYLHSFSIARPLTPITMLASFAKPDTHADNPAKASTSIAVRCRKALTDSPSSVLARHFGNALDRLVTQCFPRPVESVRGQRFPWWPHLPWSRPCLISAPSSRPGPPLNSASVQRALARPVGSIATSRISSSTCISPAGLMGTLLVIPEVKL